MAEQKSQEPSGLLHALHLDERGGANELAWQTLIEWPPEGGTLWLHFDFEEPQTHNWLQAQSDLNDVAVDALLAPETRPRMLNRANNLLLTLRGVNADPQCLPEDMTSIRIWTNGKRIISACRRPLTSTENVKLELQRGEGPKNAVELLVAWTGLITDDLADLSSDFEDEIHAIEDLLLSPDAIGVRDSIARLRRRVIATRRYLGPQREALNKLCTENLVWLDDLNRLRLREVTDRLVRYIEDLDEVRDRAMLAQEALANRLTEQMNARTYLFTLVAVIFLPLGFLTGLLGINVGGMPGADDERAFWMVVMLCAGLTVAIALFFKFRKWF